jgi:hypothetical protein
MRGEKLSTVVGVDFVLGERVKYIGPTTNELTHGECGVAWPTQGEVDSDGFPTAFDFYPDGDGIGYGIDAAELELKY